jgi:hypothetical protein
MRTFLALLVLGASLVLAQEKLTVEQVVAFVKSAIDLKQSDKEVANYLRSLTLSERLEDRTIEELEGLGAGRRTLEALRELRDTSKGLSAAPEPASREREAPVIPPPSPAEQKRVLKQTRDYALGYTHRLPDFMCTQVTRRYVDPSGLEFWQQQDVITTRLSYFEQKEDYKVILLNNQVVNMAYDAEAVGGAISSGEFGSMMKELFEPATEAEFRWERWGKLRGRLAYVFAYRVAKARSKWHVTYHRTHEVVPGYHGLVFVDRDAGAILRITLEAELPPDFPIQQATTTLDYDFAEISGQQHILPLKAVVRMREGKLLARNDVEFRLYRKFAAEATVSFETPEPLPEEKTQEQPPK